MFSCDTFAVLPQHSASGGMIFAKNTDRDPNEAHQVVLIPERDYEEGAVIETQYISILQSRHTYKVLLFKPFNIWGAEMGINEHGLCIGNEATFSVGPTPKTPALQGMDFVRLCLERCKTAVEAKDELIRLLEIYGQGGNCGYRDELFYHNSFLLVDRQNVIVLETFNKEWIWKDYTHSNLACVSISNAYSIGKDWDECSKGLIESALLKKIIKDSSEKFHFADSYCDCLATCFGRGRERRDRSKALVEQIVSHNRKIDVRDVAFVLRDHETNQYDPSDCCATAPTICMHYGPGPIRIGQTTGSVIFMLQSFSQSPHHDVVWATCTSTPCLSVFKPIAIGLDAFPSELASLLTPSGRYDDSLWWKHEVLTRTVVQDYKNRALPIMEKAKELELKYMNEVGKLIREDYCSKRSQFSKSCIEESQLEFQNQLHIIENYKIPLFSTWYQYIFRIRWNHLSSLAKIPRDSHLKVARVPTSVLWIPLLIPVAWAYYDAFGKFAGSLYFP